jgi:hypothetical protein
MLVATLQVELLLFLLPPAGLRGPPAPCWQLAAAGWELVASPGCLRSRRSLENRRPERTNTHRLPLGRVLQYCALTELDLSLGHWTVGQHITQVGFGTKTCSSQILAVLAKPTRHYSLMLTCCLFPEYMRLLTKPWASFKTAGSEHEW